LYLIGDMVAGRISGPYNGRAWEAQVQDRGYLLMSQFRSEPEARAWVEARVMEAMGAEVMG
jgi:hypothetical protein